MFVAGLVAGIVGLVLFVVELAVALGGNSLGSLGQVLLWVGVALMAVGGVLFLLAVLRSDGPRSDRVQPADG